MAIGKEDEALIRSLIQWVGNETLLHIYRTSRDEEDLTLLYLLEEALFQRRVRFVPPNHSWTLVKTDRGRVGRCRYCGHWCIEKKSPCPGPDYGDKDPSLKQ